MKKKDDIQEFMTDVHKWADETFGTERTALAPLYHLKKEVDEAIETMQTHNQWLTVEELADCFILILNSSSKYGLTFDELFIAAKDKMVKNKTRKWGNPDKNGVVEHVEEEYEKYDEQYLNDCIEKATPGLSKIKDVDEALDEIRGREPLWDNSKVIDFVNWYLRLCLVRERFQLENQNVIDSFLKGDDYKIWWGKVRDQPEQPKNIEQTSDDYYNRDKLFERKK